jgi:hypothetical protein
VVVPWYYVIRTMDNPGRRDRKVGCGGALGKRVPLRNCVAEDRCRGTGSNCRHQVFQTCALPTELPRLVFTFPGFLGGSGVRDTLADTLVVGSLG